MTDRKELCAKLRKAGFTEVVGEFSGYGDEGWTYVNTEIEDESLRDDVGHIFDEAVESVLPGFGNNEGGSGEITWNLETDKIKIEGGYYESIRHTEEFDV